MAGKKVLILGGGWGGLTLAHHLRGLLPSEHRIVVFERRDSFSLYVSYLWLMTGEREGPEQITRAMRTLKRAGIELVPDEVRLLEPAARVVETDGGRMAGDYVVIALGAELSPESVSGFQDAAHNLYELDGAASLRDALRRFDGGKIVVLITGVPFRCPAAPYEAAMLIEALTRAAGTRSQAEIALYTPEVQPMAVAGPAVGNALESMLEERDIGFFPQHAVTGIEAERGTLHFGDTTVPYDLLVGIPPHRASALVRDAGLIDGTGYVPVHPQTLEILSDVDTLETRYPNVFAIGDVTSIRLLNSMLLPKAGVFAEGQAHAVAARIAADISGDPAPRGYDGAGFCYVEVGEGMAAYGSGDFYAFPGPRVTLEAPTREARQAKEEYERLLDAWFNPPEGRSDPVRSTGA
ncbi:MAG: NAD(P)/FAD-dependent oxidoreductase [Acidimicrobiia bacterium]|nr:NAD(P)/FAD-dependent oxidoreductase [Acidimicrobiia bacterium]